MGWYTKADLVGRQQIRFGAIVRDLAVTIMLVAISCLYGCPKYNVWQQGQRGEAELARAEQNRQIAVNEAKAKLEAATLHARAEVERAKGVAEANSIIADGLKDNAAYLQYLWIDKVAGNASGQVIYVPTETGLPILESTRLLKQPEAAMKPNP